MRDYVRRILSAYYDVTAVANGQEALVCALDNPPDLVLSDVMMPRLDGFGLLKALRNAPHTRTIPIVLLTARAGEEARVEGLTEGADDYIVKPFDARELLARVSAHVELARSRQEASHREQELRREAEAARAQAERLLRQFTESENHYRLIAHATSDALWDRDLVTGETGWTGALQALFGYEASEINQDTTWWSNHIHPEDRERVLSSIHALIKSGEQFWSDEYRFRRRDETYAYILDRGYVMRDEAGAPVRMVGEIIDLTARWQEEDASLRLAAIVES
jgi:PAS domain S-box-containing protein